MQPQINWEKLKKKGVTMSNYKSKHEAIDLYHVNLTDQDVKEHIKFLLYKEMDIGLREASKLTFEILQDVDVDVDVDKLEELENLFIQAKESLVSWDKCFQIKHSLTEDPKIENISKLYPNLN